MTRNVSQCRYGVIVTRPADVADNDFGVAPAPIYYSV